MVDVITEVKYKSGKKIVVNKESFSESKIINAKTITTAKKLMIDYINENYNIEESWRVITVKSIKIKLKNNKLKKIIKFTCLIVC